MTFLKGLGGVSAAALLLCAVPAAARAGGQGGATGSPGSGQCNRCHGSNTYNGAYIEMSRDLLRQCISDELDATGAPTGYKVVSSFWSVPPNTDVPLTFVVPEAPTGEGGLFCPEGETCGTTVAGFGLEVQGAGSGYIDADTAPDLIISSGSGESGVKQAPSAEVIPGVTVSSTEVVHNAPRAYSEGEVRWNLSLNTRFAVGGAITVYGSANVCNGNNSADAGDVTSRMQETIYLQDNDGNTQAPCQVVEPCASGQYLDAFGECTCPEGTSLTTYDDSGQLTDPYCAAQGLCAQSETPKTATWPAAAVLVFAGFALRRRRRRA